MTGEVAEVRKIAWVRYALLNDLPEVDMKLIPFSLSRHGHLGHPGTAARRLSQDIHTSLSVSSSYVRE